MLWLLETHYFNLGLTLSSFVTIFHKLFLSTSLLTCTDHSMYCFLSHSSVLFTLSYLITPVFAVSFPTPFLSFSSVLDLCSRFTFYLAAFIESPSLHYSRHIQHLLSLVQLHPFHCLLHQQFQEHNFSPIPNFSRSHHFITISATAYCYS